MEWTPVADAAVGQWLAASLEKHWGRTSAANYAAAVIPRGFAAYARLLHPAYSGSEAGELTWSQVAKLSGRTPHAQMQWQAISFPGISEPCTGHLPDRQAKILAEILCRYTSTPETCYFAIWDGWGFPEVRKLRDQTARLYLPDRAYYLLKGNLKAALEGSSALSWRAVNIWWPEDRRWCAATEVDLMWTYIGGEEACINAILSDRRLETWRAALDDRLDVLGDEINQ